MTTPYDDPTRAFERELRRAERERRRLVAVAGLAGIAIVGLVAIIGAVVSVRGAAASAETGASKRVELARDTAPAEQQAAVDTPSAEAAPKPTAPTPTVESEKPAAAATQPKPEPAKKPAAEPAVQRLSVAIGQYGYDPETLQAKAGIPIKLTVAKGEGCAAGFLIPSLNISADNSSGPATVNIPALDPGSYQFMCAMQMVSGTLVVK